METRRRTPDGNGHGDGDGSGDGRTEAEMGTGTRITGTRIGSGRAEEAKKRKKPQNSCRRHVGNGGDLSGKRKNVETRKGWSSRC